MTTFDEDALKKALRETADGFAVSTDAVERILDEARVSVDDVRTPRLRTLYRRYGRTRSTIMAVAASIVVLGVAVPLFNTESPSIAANALRVSNHQTGAGEKVLISGSSTPGAQDLAVGSEGLTPGSPTNNSGSTFEATGTAVTTSAKLSVQSSNSSLRVEEVGTIHLSVGDKKFQATLTQLTDFATTDGGFVASTQAHMGTKATGTFSSGSIVLQVPERRFTMLVNQVRHAGLATSVVTSATDVAGQYVDLQARISALQVSREQYLKIMTRTSSISGILSVQNQLNSIQSQIEELQAQLGLLNNETTYATLTVSLSEAGHTAIPVQHARTGVDKAWHESLHGFAAGFEWLIRIAGPLLFALLLVAALLALGRLAWRATARRRGRID